MSAHLAHIVDPHSADVFSLAAMWFGMMAVMMAPVAWPWVRAFSRLESAAVPAWRAISTVSFVAGYAAAWLLFSAAAALIQTFAAGAFASSVRRESATLGAIVLIGAGLMQFSRLKRACLRHCRSPFGYLLQRWRNGPTASWRIGFGHGLYCVGCCWALMATMLVVGMSNWGWMAALTAATLGEQVARRGELARVAIGTALVLAGCGRLL